MNAAVHQGEKMIQWAADGSGVRVETNKNVYYAQTLVLCSGPWIAEHVPQLKVTDATRFESDGRCEGCRVCVKWKDK